MAAAVPRTVKVVNGVPTVAGTAADVTMRWVRLHRMTGVGETSADIEAETSWTSADGVEYDVDVAGYTGTLNVVADEGFVWGSVSAATNAQVYLRLKRVVENAGYVWDPLGHYLIVGRWYEITYPTDGNVCAQRYELTRGDVTIRVEGHVEKSGADRRFRQVVHDASGADTGSPDVTVATEHYFSMEIAGGTCIIRRHTGPVTAPVPSDPVWDPSFGAYTAPRIGSGGDDLDPDTCGVRFGIDSVTAGSGALKLQILGVYGHLPETYDSRWSVALDVDFTELAAADLDHTASTLALGGYTFSLVGGSTYLDDLDITANGLTADLSSTASTWATSGPASVARLQIPLADVVPGYHDGMMVWVDAAWANVELWSLAEQGGVYVGNSDLNRCWAYGTGVDASGATLVAYRTAISTHTPDAVAASADTVAMAYSSASAHFWHGTSTGTQPPKGSGWVERGKGAAGQNVNVTTPAVFGSTNVAGLFFQGSTGGLLSCKRFRILYIPDSERPDI